jgi:hypothetical protein
MQAIFKLILKRRHPPASADAKSVRHPAKGCMQMQAVSPTPRPGVFFFVM